MAENRAYFIQYFNRKLRVCNFQKSDKRKNNFPILLVNCRNPILIIRCNNTYFNFSDISSPESTSSIVLNLLRESNGLPRPVLRKSRFLEKTGFSTFLQADIAVCKSIFVSELISYIIKIYPFPYRKSIPVQSASFSCNIYNSMNIHQSHIQRFHGFSAFQLEEASCNRHNTVSAQHHTFLEYKIGHLRNHEVQGM